MDGDLTHRRASELLGSPLGCTFLVAISEADDPFLAISDPANVLRLAAECADYLDPFGVEHLDNVSLVLKYGQSRRSLAEDLLDHPNSNWWFSPLNRNRQIWIARYGQAFQDVVWERSPRSSKQWETKAQKPAGGISTSTQEGSVSSQMVAYDLQVGDHIIDFPLTVVRVAVPQTHRIFEIHGPEDWHTLCESYPGSSQGEPGDIDGKITPDWDAISLDWDGVHLSFGGLLTCEQTHYERNGTWSMHGSWQSELSYWFNTDGITVTEISEYARNTKSSEVEIPVFDEQLEPGSIWPRGLRPAPAVLPLRPPGFRVARR